MRELDQAISHSHHILTLVSVLGHAAVIRYISQGYESTRDMYAKDIIDMEDDEHEKTEDDEHKETEDDEHKETEDNEHKKNEDDEHKETEDDERKKNERAELKKAKEVLSYLKAVHELKHIKDDHERAA